jgi:endonuclease YncB( thermonuclease family)
LKTISIFKSAATMLPLFLVFQVQADTLLGKVIHVQDGDTITVLAADKVQHKILLAGIDAPEKAQRFGNKSKQRLSDLVFGKTVSVDTDKTDRYGREVGKVQLDGVDANLEQVRRGLAWHYKAYQREQSPEDRLAYAAAEKDAAAARLGLWQDAVPVAPWEWRHPAKVAP